MPGTVALRERPGVPARLVAAPGRHDPDLEDRRRLGFEIVFRMADAAAGAHHLHVTRLGAALVAEAVLMGDRALPHIGDDLHIFMRVRRKPGLRRDLVVVPDAQRAPPHALGVAVIGKREMMAGLQPAMVAAAEAVERPAFDHDMSPRRRSAWLPA